MVVQPGSDTPRMETPRPDFRSTRRRSRLDDALALLDPQARQMVRLWLDGATGAEIATELALPERVVEMTRARAVNTVREFIARQPPPRE